MSLEMPNQSITSPIIPEGPLSVPTFPGQAPVAAPVAAPVVAPVVTPVMAPVQQHVVDQTAQIAQMVSPVAAPVHQIEQVAPVASAPVQPENLVASFNQPEIVYTQPQPEMMHIQMEISAPAQAQEIAPVQAPTAQVQIPVQESAPQQILVNPVVTPEIGNINNMGMDLSAVIAPEDEVKLKEQEKVVAPISIGGLQSIGSCKIANWGGVMKVLEFVSKDLSKEEIIMIDNGTLDTNKDGAFIHCDLKNILGDISLNITSPAISTKKLKIIRGGDLLQIFKEEATNSYVFCNIQDGKILTRVKTRFASAEADSFSKAPTLPEPTYQKEISANDKEVLKTIIAGKSADENDEPYRFGFSKIDNTLVSIGVGKDFTHFFQDSNIPSDEYKVFYPFPVSNMDSCIIKIYMTQDQGIWLQTISNVEFASIVCTEKIEVIDSSVEDFNF